ncbi:MAG: methylmalonyl Co-A mutase-associated GTPase MeaB [Bacteroidetes bacterium SB0662_bin_6]|nr:methylmalonyl Co-A mutase-associated GTPase MeaB [Bacteroidetes bacterium SB0668_bin_1]MYE03475.1 methylmalonyl Co-A mutase-associated GTPase MeaB [Bacteroidetes bacterium SB0662_bin_6]
MTFPSAEELFEGIRDRDRVMLARGITLVESTHADHWEQAKALLDICLPLSGKASRIGITGAPGVGKSTFIEAFASRLISSENRRVAVLAYDPASERTGGSILGDKTRMTRLSNHPKAFVRPAPGKRQAGGIGGGTRQSIILCEAAGYDTVFVETVGSGQAETRVSDMVDFLMLLTLPGSGDELQGVKRGVMEEADMVILTKEDAHSPKAVRLGARHMKTALRLFPPKESDWTPPVHTCSAQEETGLDIIRKDLADYEQLVRTSGYLEARRRRQIGSWLRETFDARLLETVRADAGVSRLLEEYEEQAARHEIAVTAAVDLLLKAFLEGGEGAALH